jgi:8-oxo-dGTP pyrophosphatase MutT (NUDIX family)
MMKCTITYIVNPIDETVLLAKKTRKIGVGYYFGFGGGIEKDQTPTQNAVEETWDETGGKKENRVNPNEEGGIRIYEDKLIPMALIDFYKGKDCTDPVRVLFYVTSVFEGKAIDTKEMVGAEWFPINQFPSEMKPGDELILNRIFNGETVKGYLRFDPDDGDKVLDYSIEPCTTEDLVI